MAEGSHSRFYTNAARVGTDWPGPINRLEPVSNMCKSGSDWSDCKSKLGLRSHKIKSILRTAFNSTNLKKCHPNLYSLD